MATSPAALRAGASQLAVERLKVAKGKTLQSLENMERDLMDILAELRAPAASVVLTANSLQKLKRMRDQLHRVCDKQQYLRGQVQA